MFEPNPGASSTELLFAIRKLYEPAGMQLTSKVIREAESLEYDAWRFSLNDYNVVFRKAKITPRKTGQFVTLWKRSIDNASITPLDIMDNIEFVIVNLSDSAYSGQFIFDKKILLTKNIMSQYGKGGKRAFRIYPPWDSPIAKDAKRTQEWQAPYFLSVEKDGPTNLEKVRILFAKS